MKYLYNRNVQLVCEMIFICVLLSKAVFCPPKYWNGGHGSEVYCSSQIVSASHICHVYVCRSTPSWSFAGQ